MFKIAGENKQQTITVNQFEDMLIKCDKQNQSMHFNLDYKFIILLRNKYAFHSLILKQTRGDFIFKTTIFPQDNDFSSKQRFI